jgi:hypothetical protein
MDLCKCITFLENKSFLSWMSNWTLGYTLPLHLWIHLLKNISRLVSLPKPPHPPHPHKKNSTSKLALL